MTLIPKIKNYHGISLAVLDSLHFQMMKVSIGNWQGGSKFLLKPSDNFYRYKH